MQLNTKREMQPRWLADASTRASAPKPPRAIVDWFERLSDEGHKSLLLGECVLQLALGLQPRHYRAHSSISRDALLALAPRAIPTRVEPATVTIPTAAGPLDMVPNRSFEQTLDELQSVPFAALALALDPQRGVVIAQDQTREDIASRILSPAPTARICGDDGDDDGDGIYESGGIDSDSGFALEAARLIAVYGLSPTGALLDAARKQPCEAAPARPSDHRRRLREMLLAPGVRAGLTFLRDSGAEQALVPGVRPDAAAIVAGVPAEPRVRFCAWLQGADAKRLLRGFRLGGEFSTGLHRLLEYHPIDEWVQPGRGGSPRRLQKQLFQAEIADLLWLRRAEARAMNESGRSGDAHRLLRELEQLERTLAQVREEQRRRRERTPLAISSAEIMQLLACGPGPKIGRAIRFLERTFADDPGANTREALARALAHWRDER